MRFFDTHHVLEFCHAVTIVANLKCCKNIGKDPHRMKNVQGKHLRVKDVNQWNQMRMGHSGCEFYYQEEETFYQMM